MADTPLEQEWVEIDLKTIARGALPELFARAHQEVLENIGDPNTNATKKREVHIKLVYAPAPGGESCHVTADVAVKLAAVKQVAQVIHLGTRGGKRVAVGQQVQQATLPGVLPDPATAGVLPISRANN